MIRNDNQRVNGFFKFFDPLIGNYHLWLREIKRAFDPDNVSDPAFYVSLEPEKLIQEEMERRPAMAASLLQFVEESSGEEETAE